ncbi:MAG: hypothetical protein ACON3Z_07165 [Bradymonadia bacterium]
MTTGKKRKKGRQKSKAAIERDRLRGSNHGHEADGLTGSAVETPQYRGGVMSNMRSGFQSAVGQGENTGKGSKLNTVLWIAVIGAATFMLVKQFQ